MATNKYDVDSVAGIIVALVISALMWLVGYGMYYAINNYI